jgi:hypothetical protein
MTERAINTGGNMNSGNTGGNFISLYTGSKSWWTPT